MESGYRVGPNGAMIPRDIIRLFTCTYNGEEMFRAELSPAIAANPFLSFFTTARRERHARVPLDRRQRLRGNPDRRDHGRVTRCCALRRALWLAGRCRVVVGGGARAADLPASERRSGYDFMSRRDPRDAG